jgi:hypothetical protein
MLSIWQVILALAVFAAIVLADPQGYYRTPRVTRRTRLPSRPTTQIYFPTLFRKPSYPPNRFGTLKYHPNTFNTRHWFVRTTCFPLPFRIENITPGLYYTPGLVADLDVLSSSMLQTSQVHNSSCYRRCKTHPSDSYCSCTDSLAYSSTWHPCWYKTGLM